MHHRSVSTNYPWLPHNIDPENHPTPPEYVDMKIQPLGDINERYEHYMNGCVNAYGGLEGRGARCIENETDRWKMSLRQPQSMKNYTKMGYTKIRAPDRVYELLKEFWDKNKQFQKPEKWYPANIYT
jgi:prolyl 4-hydroxylase